MYLYEIHQQHLSILDVVDLLVCWPFLDLKRNNGVVDSIEINTSLWSERKTNKSFPTNKFSNTVDSKVIFLKEKRNLLLLLGIFNGLGMEEKQKSFFLSSVIFHQNYLFRLKRGDFSKIEYNLYGFQLILTNNELILD